MCRVEGEGGRWKVAYGDREAKEEVSDAASRRYAACKRVLAVTVSTLEIQPQIMDWYVYGP